ncbi:MAG: alanyl-tRNA editing protein, partial [Mesorhizobium sp.]
IIHVPPPEQAVPEVGEPVKLALNWQRRHLLMRMHTACHLLTVVCPFPITGASVSEDDSRIDFDIPDAGFTREDVT